MTRRKTAGKDKTIMVARGRQQPKNGNGKKKKGEQHDFAMAYKAALMNPFSTAAQGARVPDMYSAPTVPKHFTQSYSLSTGSLTNYPAQLIILPNLYMPVICPMGLISGGVSWVTMDGVTNGTCVINPTANVSSQLTNWRIVGYGVRLYGTSTILSTSGRVLVATNPVSSWINYKPATIGGQATTSNNAAASATNTLTAYGFPATMLSGAAIVDSAAMPGMQNCLEQSLVGLAARPLVVTPKINSPEAFEFKQSADSAIGFSINNQTSASFVSSGDASYLRVSGHEAVVISVLGAPVSTAVLQVEIVYHVEGTPASSVLTGDSPQVIAAPSTMAEIVAAAARSEPFKQGIEMAGNAVLPGLGTFARTFT